MRKSFLVLVTVVVLLGLTVWGDRQGGGGPAGGGGAAGQIIDLQGKELDLSAYRGKVVLVNFWATWCTPCRQEMPWMIEFQDKYAERGFTVLGVGMDDEGRSVIEPFVEKERYPVNGVQRTLNYPILIGGPKVGEQFEIFGLPTSVIIGRDGKEVKKFVGLVNHDKLVKEIEGQL